MKHLILLTFNVFISFQFNNAEKNITNQIVFPNEPDKITKCGGILTSNDVLIESPNYPGPYPSNIQCMYKLRSESCSVNFEIEFIKFDLESEKNCEKDYLFIKGVDKICGSISGKRKYEFRGELNLIFTSDNQINYSGFQIRVKRLPCLEEKFKKLENITEKSASFCAYPSLCNQPVPTAFPNFLPSGPGYQIPAYLPKCCANWYNTYRFYLSSPGFPYSSNFPTDCVYHIHKANWNICQIRIIFRYFWVGNHEFQRCQQGFVEIDGRRYCGCQTGTTVISRFGFPEIIGPKVIRYFNTGYPRTALSGFALEIIQEPCYYRYENEKNSTKEEYKEYIYPRHLETFDEDEQEKPNISIYFYTAPDFEVEETTPTILVNPANIPENSTDIEEDARNFSGSETSNFGVGVGIGDILCKKWTLKEWVALAALDLFQQNGRCIRPFYPTPCPSPFPPIPPFPPLPPPRPFPLPFPIPTREPETKECIVLNNPTGNLQSPGYPQFYPSALSICYRIQRSRGNCGFRLKFSDFDIEPSLNCHKAALQIEAKRYCGQSLANSPLNIDLTRKEFEDLTFESDNSPYHSGRGFLATYEQSPCVIIPKPDAPSHPTCGGYFETQNFKLESSVNEFKPLKCDYRIIKVNPKICQVSLEFEKFDLDCRFEYIMIHSVRYCGRELSGKTIHVNFMGQPGLDIVYMKRTVLYPGGNFFIRGTQTDHTCFLKMNVPAEIVLLSKDATVN